MSIFDLKLFENKRELKDKLFNYLSSDEFIFEFFLDSSDKIFLPNNIINASITIKNLTNSFLLNYGIPISVDNLNKLSVYELIELFLNIENDLDFLIEKYKKEQKWKVIIHENKKKIDLHLKNLINSFLKEFNIKNKNEGEKIFLDLSNVYLIENIQNKPLQILIRDYIKIKDSEKSDENLEKKINILSGLKNNADNYFVKNLDNFNEFIRINNSKLKGFWQAIGSHRSSTIKKNKYLDIKKEFDNLTIEEKHNKVNQILDAIIYILFIHNF